MFGSLTSVNASSMPGSASDEIGKDDSGSLPPSFAGSIKGFADDETGKDCGTCHSVPMPDSVKNVNGDEGFADSSSSHSGCIDGSADDEAGKSVDAAQAASDPVRMPDFVKNEDGTETGEIGPVCISREAEHVLGKEFSPADPEDAFDDLDEVDEQQEDYPFEVPKAGAGYHWFIASEVKFTPDIIAHSAKMQKLTLEEVQAMNKESGIFTTPLEELEIPIRDLEGYTRNLITGLDPLTIWQLVREGDDDITTKVLHPLLHEHLMPEMRKNGNLPTHTLKTLKFAVLEVLVLMLKNAYYLNGMSGAGLSGHSRFASSVTYRLVQPVRDILNKCRVESNRKISALVADLDRKRRDENASPTRNEEEALHLTAKRKADVFMNGVSERRKCGTIFEFCHYDNQKLLQAIQVHFEQLIQLRKGDRQNVVELFEDDSSMSAKDLLDVLDECLDVHQSGVYSKGFSKTLFYAHRGVGISFLCKHLNKIREDLESDEWLNVKHNPYWEY